MFQKSCSQMGSSGREMYQCSLLPLAVIQYDFARRGKSLSLLLGLRYFLPKGGDGAAAGGKEARTRVWLHNSDMCICVFIEYILIFDNYSVVEIHGLSSTGHDEMKNQLSRMQCWGLESRGGNIAGKSGGDIEIWRRSAGPKLEEWSWLSSCRGVPSPFSLTPFSHGS